MSASPWWATQGNYAVSWSTPLGCYYTYYPPPYQVPMGYGCMSLQEKVGAAGWTDISTASGSTSWNASGKPQNTYQYQIFHYYCDYAFGCNSGVQEGPVTVVVGPAPPTDPVSTQRTYQFEIRAGDINADGRTDIFVKRTSGGVSGNGVLENVILRQNSSGGTFSVVTPEGSQLATASAWPISSASIVVDDFNVDGFVDVEVKNVGAAVGVPGAADQIVFSPAAFYDPRPRGLRAVDASLKKFVGNSLDYFVDPNYFEEHAIPRYFYGQFIFFSCNYTSVLLGIIETQPWYMGTCQFYNITISGTYMDYTMFNSDAIAIWMSEEALTAGASSAAQSTQDAQEATEAALGVEVGGWAMEEALGSTGEHNDPNLRRALEVFWAILGIARANAQDIDTDEAPSQAPRTGSDIYLVGHGAKILGLPTGNHVALEFNSNPAIPCVSNQIPTCNTISAHPRDGEHVVYVPNAIEDQPQLNMTMGIVQRPPTPSSTLWAEMLARAEAYDNDAPYNALCLPFSSGYNSNSFIVGLINVVNASTDYDVSDLWCGDRPLPASYFD